MEDWFKDFSDPQPIGVLIGIETGVDENGVVFSDVYRTLVSGLFVEDKNAQLGHRRQFSSVFYELYNRTDWGRLPPITAELYVRGM